MERIRHPGSAPPWDGQSRITLRSIRATALPAKLRQSLGFRCIFGRVDVEERIDWLCRPVRNRHAVAGGPYLDLAKIFLDESMPQVLAQGHRPQRHHRVAPIAGTRAGERHAGLLSRLMQPHDEIVGQKWAIARNTDNPGEVGPLRSRPVEAREDAG